jgi:hypothetical protein
MHLGEERGYGGREPSLATELEPAKMAAPICRAEHCVRVLLELFVRNARVLGDLEAAPVRAIPYAA